MMWNHHRISYTIKITLALFLLQLTVITFLIPAEAATRQEPVNIGFIFSLPWDVSNTLRAPLAGPLSIVLAGGLALILVFGLLASPLWYLFGVPIRKYHMHEFNKLNITAILEGDDGRSRSLGDFDGADDIPYGFLHGNHSSLGAMDPGLLNLTGDGDNQNQGRQFVTEEGYPDFMNSLFFFVPELQEDCRKLLVCHAHGFLSFLPEVIVESYHFFSKKLLNVPECYKSAIVTGLMDQGSCMKTYRDCTQDIVTIAKSTLFYNIPHDMRELWQLQDLHF